MSNPHYLKYKESIKKSAKEQREKQDQSFLKQKLAAGVRFHYHNNKDQIKEKKIKYYHENKDKIKNKRNFDKERNRLFNLYEIYIQEKQYKDKLIRIISREKSLVIIYKMSRLVQYLTIPLGKSSKLRLRKF